MYNNIIDQLNYFTNLNPNKIIMIQVDDEKNVTEKYTYRQFKIVTDRLAMYLININQEKVVLVYPPGLDFMVAFIACIKAKVIPIPVYPPNPNYLKKDLIQFCKIVESSNVSVEISI